MGLGFIILFRSFPFASRICNSTELYRGALNPNKHLQNHVDPRESSCNAMYLAE